MQLINEDYIYKTFNFVQINDLKHIPTFGVVTGFINEKEISCLNLNISHLIL